jgi:hypothetical protein
MENSWKNEGATGSKRSLRLQGENSSNKPFRLPHGKEGVRGSSPREGFRKFLLISFFRRLMRRQKRCAASTERPRAAAVFSYESAKSCC